jgi:hypothetical protein
MRTWVGPLVGLALCCSSPVVRAQTPATPDEVARLRDEVQQLRQSLAALEARLDTMQAATAPPPAAAPGAALPPTATADVPAGAAGAGGPSGPLPVYGAPTSKVFNPDIAVIGDFQGAVGRPEGSGQPSLEMREAEASFQAIVDPYARADFFLTFGPDEVGIEEAFLTFPTLPAKLLMKVGKMRTAFGKVDAMHAHTLPWTDRPLVTQNLLGGEEGLADSGVSLSRILNVPGVFLEATGQVFAGSSEVFQGRSRSDVTWLGHLRAYRDLTESTNLELGGSIAYGGNDAEGGDNVGNAAGSGAHTRLWGTDLTFRYRPLRRAIYRQVVLRNELVWSRRDHPGGAPPADAFGTYVGLDYQFARRWFAGVRGDYSERADDPTLVDKGGSFLLTFWPSEFSQIRAQYRRTRLGEGTNANELFFQFLFSIGAHGAHAF